MTRNERKLKAIEDTMAKKAHEIQEIWTREQKEDRELTEDERNEVLERTKALEELKKDKAEAEANIEVEKEVKSLSKDLGKAEEVTKTDARVVNEPPRVKTLGQQFVESEAYKSIEQKEFSGQWSTGRVELKGTLLEGSSAPGSGSGGGFVAAPQVVPGVRETLFQRLTVADLLGSAQTNSNTIRYVVEGTATSGAAGVAEGGAKPQSTLGVGTIDEPVKKIATTLKVSDEMVEDAAQVESYINGRLSLFVKIEEERQLLLGGGTNELVGLTGRAVNTYARGTVDTYAVALFKALNGTRGSAFVEPTGIIMNPTDWQTVRLATDTAGQFFGGGPFLGPYGGPQGPVGASGQVTGAQDTIWNKPVVVTSAIGAGTALLGDFQMSAAIYRRSGLSVEATNSNEDDFLHNLVALRAEERLALAVYRPKAFTKVVF